MISLDDLFIEYIELVAPLQSHHTIVSKKSAYKKHIKDRFGASLIDDLKYKDFQLFINDLLKSGLKPKTVKNIKDLLQVIYKMGVRLEYISYNPLLSVELPKFDNKMHFNYPLEYQKRFINAILTFDEPIYSDIFIFLLHGRRLNEVLSLEWSMIDLDQKIYFIPAKINKAKRNMQYKMTDRLYLILYERFVDIVASGGSLEGYIFKNPRTDTKFVDLRKPWKRLLKKANLPHCRIHDIRHLIGTYSINHLEIPIEKVSHTLGHTSIEVTQKYITMNPETAKDVIENLIDSVGRI